jgi:hypothetical protein
VPSKPAIAKPTHHQNITMTTTQPTPSSPPEQSVSGFAVNTIPLYGILVTEKSFLLGKRALALQSHASYLAHRVAGERLPPELCDEIGAHLRTLLHQGAKRLWKGMKDDPRARADRFQYNGRAANARLTAAETAGRAAYLELARREVAGGGGGGGGTVKIQAAEALLDVPGGGARHGSTSNSNSMRYIHLSASLGQPGLSVLAPGAVSCAGGPEMSFAQGAMVANHQPASARGPSAEVLCVRWDGRSGGAARLLQLDDVEASMRGWDQALVEEFVGRLGLVPVVVRGEEGTRGGMEPRLRLLQRLRWGQHGLFKD